MEITSFMYGRMDQYFSQISYSEKLHYSKTLPSLKLHQHLNSKETEDTISLIYKKFFFKCEKEIHIKSNTSSRKIKYTNKNQVYNILV